MEMDLSAVESGTVFSSDYCLFKFAPYLVVILFFPLGSFAPGIIILFQGHVLEYSFLPSLVTQEAIQKGPLLKSMIWQTHSD